MKRKLKQDIIFDFVYYLLFMRKLRKIEAAKLLKISRSTLDDNLKKLYNRIKDK